jgi:hypothetical protein
MGLGLGSIEDPEFIGAEFHNNNIMERTFTRKLKKMVSNATYNGMTKRFSTI